MRASSAIGWIVPISLFACMTETSAVSSVSAAFERFRLDDAGLVDRQQRGPPAAAGERLQRDQDRLVLDGGRDEVSPAGRLERFGGAAKCKIVGLGAAAGEYKFRGLCADKSRDRGPGLVHDGFGLLTEAVHARGIAEIFAEGADHHVGDRCGRPGSWRYGRSRRA